MASFAAKVFDPKEMTRTVDDELVERRLQGLRYALGETVMNALNDPNVIEVRLNCDGKLWIDSFDGKKQAGVISSSDAMVILNQVASALNDGDGVSKEKPSVAGELPLNGERFQGVAPPVVENATFAIRKKALKVFPLSEYVRARVLSFAQAEALRVAIKERQNILIVGATKSGKTTFGNALLNELAMLMPDIRMLIMEDVKELQCSLVDRVFLRANQWTSMREITEWILRLSPDSITVGEVRAGAAALAVLKAWNTGHPGGFLTIHADSAEEGLTRTNQLIQEVSASPMYDLIGRAINVVVFLQYDKGVRSVKEILRVHGYDHGAHKFKTEAII